MEGAQAVIVRRLADEVEWALVVRDGMTPIAPPPAGAPLAIADRQMCARPEWEALERDGWRCAVPACSSRANLHDHHLLFRSRGGDNARENRITICA